MKRNILLLLLCLVQVFAHSQINSNSQWTWVKGDSTTEVLGVYGTMGTADDANKPGARQKPASWKDASGNFWMFGGQSSTPSAFFADMWKYNPLSNQWTWVNGSSAGNTTAVYGTLGVEDPGNHPGARYVSMSWVDASGNFWLFGGLGYATNSNVGGLNDLWKYNPATNAWTWVKGDSIINIGCTYGTRGVPAPGNKPGARSSSATWTDAAGNLWLFGGTGNISTGSSSTNQNDLWKYNPSTNEWTWMNGDNVGNSSGSYGTKGFSSATNTPGGRYGSLSWKDLAGNFWLFGGETYSPISGSFFCRNDLWKYDPSTNQWAWMNGDNTPNNTSVYGTQGVADPTNKPGGRHFSVSWSDALGNIWFFGGKYSSRIAGSSTIENNNDLWKYNIASDMWTWVKGSNTPYSFGSYGSLNLPSPTNQPGARLLAISWIDDLGNPWLFGGSGSAASIGGTLNDLWKLNEYVNVVPVTLLNVSATLADNTIKVTWQTASEINTLNFVVERSADGRIFSALGTVAAAGNSAVTKAYYFIDQHPFSTVNYYRVKIISRDGSVNYSSLVMVKSQTSKDYFAIFPNPVISVSTISLTSPTNALLTLHLYDSKGQLVHSKQVPLTKGINSFSFDMSKLPKAVYLAVLKWGEETKEVQVIKQ
jgi:N-acetylneuraminic acid mutarotase